MSADVHTEVTKQSWFSRLGGAFKGVIAGFILVFVGCWFLFWNEGRAVKRHKTLREGGGLVVSVAAEQIDPANNGKLVHVSGQATTPEILADEEFGILANAIHLKREVEMYQWRQREQSETRKKLGGGTETVTTYSYEKAWSDRPISSASFKRPEGHENPASFPYQGRTVSATDVSLEAFRLSPGLISKMSSYKPVTISSLDLLPSHLRYRARLHSGGVFLGRDPLSPEVGDLRIRFSQVDPGPVSVVAAQQGGGLGPYQTEVGGTIQLLSNGYVGADAMFKAAEASNRFTTWMFRLFGFIVILVGWRTVLKPLSVMADVVPFIGNMVEVGTGIIAFFIGAFSALCTIAVAWLFYRPLLAVGLIVLAVVAVLFMRSALKRAKRRRPAPPPPPAAAGTG